MELEENKTYTNKQLAEWFGISYGSFRNKREQKMEELKTFVDYKMISKGKCKILKVYNPVYSKKQVKAYDEIKVNTLKYWNKNGLDTSKNVANKIYNGEPEIRALVKLNTMYNYVIKSKTEMFGTPYNNDGEIGTCSYEWSKRGSDGNPIPFNEEENKIKEEVVHKYYGDITEEGLMLMGEYKAGRLKSEEALARLDAILTASGEVKNLNSEQKFFAFLDELSQKVKSPVVKATRVQELKPKDEPKIEMDRWDF